MNRYFILYILAYCLVSCNNEAIQQEPEQLVCDNGTFIVDTYDGFLRLESQEEVDEFGALCHTKIEGGLIIDYPDDISEVFNLNALENLIEVTGRVEIYDDNLISLAGLNNLKKVSSIWITNCDNLIDLSGLNGLEKVTNKIAITCNDNITSFSGLESLTQVGELHFGGNARLEDIDALFNLSSANLIDTKTSCFSSASGFINLTTNGNPLLTNLCGLQNLFLSGTFNIDTISIEDNAYNPSVQDIIDGNCAQ